LFEHSFPFLSFLIFARPLRTNLGAVIFENTFSIFLSHISGYSDKHSSFGTSGASFAVCVAFVGACTTRYAASFFLCAANAACALSRGGGLLGRNVFPGSTLLRNSWCSRCVGAKAEWIMNVEAQLEHLCTSLRSRTKSSTSTRTALQTAAQSVAQPLARPAVQ
jgi:hypothetical protein